MPQERENRQRASGSEGAFAEAVRCFKTAHHEQALKLTRLAASKGYARAQYFLSLLYEYGFARGLAHDRERKGEKRLAAYWRKKAAEAGYEKPVVRKPVFPEAALCEEADRCAAPANPERDDRKAAALYRRVAEGNPEAVNKNGISCASWAMEALLELYGAGLGLSVDTEAWLTGQVALGGVGRENAHSPASLRALAALALSRLFAGGHGVERDESLTVLWLQQALCLTEAESAWWMPDAQYELGRHYLEGRGVEQDNAEAAAWFALAAEGNNTAAQCILGHLYREGRGLERNTAQAMHWYRRACADIVEYFGMEDAKEWTRALRKITTPSEFAALLSCTRTEAEDGNVDAWFLLGVLYIDGSGVRKKPGRAAFWIKKAAKAGDAEARYLLGYFAEQGIGMAKSIKAALRWRQKAAEKNFFFSENLECFGEDYDGEKRRWLQRQAKKGNKFAQYELAFQAGIRLKRKAGLLRQAAEQGNRSAQHHLGLAYCEGDGVKQDYAQAAHWLRQAAGNPETPPHFENEPGLPQSDLAHLYREGKGVERNPALAAEWYEKSFDDGNCCAALALAMARECGCGVERDTAKARALYAHRLGDLREGAHEVAEFFLELMMEQRGTCHV